MSDRVELCAISPPTSLDYLIQRCLEAKELGATQVQYDFPAPGTPWAFEWIRFYKVKTDDEIKEERIKELRMQLEKLENSKQ